MAADSGPYASPKPSEPKSRWTVLLSLLAILILVFVIAKVAGTISSNSAVFEDRYAVDEGDLVTVLYTIRSAESGDVLSSSETVGHEHGDQTGAHDHGEQPGVTALQFVVGSGQSGFGDNFERAVVGHYQGETVRWGPVDGTEAFGAWEELPAAFPRVYGPFELEQTLNQQFIQAYEQQRGPLEEGATIRVFSDFPWSQKVVNKTSDSVLIRHDVKDGDSYPWEVPPSDLVLDVNEDEKTFTVTFEAETGTTFVVLPNTQGALFFEPGSYRIAEVTDDQIHFEYNTAPDPAVVGQDVIVEIRILQLQKAPEPTEE